MNRKKLFAKYYKNLNHDYEIAETLQYKDDKQREIDIAFVYSGRNRGKSFEICTQLLADAWYDGKEFGYIRRHDATNFEIEQYFADKSDFIKDMTDNEYDSIIRDKGKLYFCRDVREENGEIKKIKSLNPCGYFFALSRQSSYKSLQFPKLFNLIYEEVLTDDASGYLSSEPEKLMNLYSTCRRSKPDFKLWLVSNTISIVNPYSTSWGIYLSKNRAGEVRLSKLYLGSYDQNGNEEYYLIAAHYLKDKGDITKEERRKKKNRVKTSIASNKWDELHLYATLPMRLVRDYDIEETVVFEYDDVLIQGDIIQIPKNLIECYINDSDKYSKELMPVMYIRRKTSEPKPNTRVYSNNPNHFNNYTTKGFKKIYKIDKVVEALYTRGWMIGADNLTMNDFNTIFKKLLIRYS